MLLDCKVAFLDGYIVPLDRDILLLFCCLGPDAQLDTLFFKLLELRGDERTLASASFSSWLVFLRSASLAMRSSSRARLVEASSSSMVWRASKSIWSCARRARRTPS